MAGIGRKNGSVVNPVTLHGGYQTKYYLIAGTAVSAADTTSGGFIVEGTFTKAVRAVQTIATTVFIGPRADNGFLIGVDAATAQPDGPAYDTDATPDFETRLQVLIRAATGVSGATVTEKTLTLADFA